MELIARHLDREEKVHLERTESGYRITVGEAGRHSRLAEDHQREKAHRLGLVGHQPDKCAPESDSFGPQGNSFLIVRSAVVYEVHNGQNRLEAVR